MFIQSFDMEFKSQARTLAPEEVRESGSQTGDHTRTHKSGWTISGYVHEDWYEWVNDFEAEHPLYGKVYGNFEDKVYAESEAGYRHFITHHEPEEWDYWDI